MYTLDYKLPFSTIALIHEADYVAKIHFNSTYVSFLSLVVDWTNLFGKNVSGEFTTGTRAHIYILLYYMYLRQHKCDKENNY